PQRRQPAHPPAGPAQSHQGGIGAARLHDLAGIPGLAGRPADDAVADVRLLPPATLPGDDLRFPGLDRPDHLPWRQGQGRGDGFPGDQALRSGQMNMKTISLAVAALGAGFLVAQSALAAGSSDADVVEVIKSSFRERGQARLDRLEQTDLQRECSKYQGRPVPKEVAERIEKKALADVKYPADGKFLGDWKKGEKIAQSGRGFQYNDKPGSEAGGNCYACHQLASHEVSFGNIGPSLHNYGKLRGYSPEVVRYTWARIWNPHSFKACNQMPRFGAAGILTEEQIRDVMALLLDPESPVNK